MTKGLVSLTKGLVSLTKGLVSVVQADSAKERRRGGGAREAPSSRRGIRVGRVDRRADTAPGTTLGVGGDSRDR